MKIISNNELYVRRSDIEFLSHYDRDFPLELAIDHLIDNLENKYVKITNPKHIDYLLEQNDVLDFNILTRMKKEDIKKMILKLKMKMYEESDKEEGMTPEEFRKSQIESYKNRMRIEYLISQLKEANEYKKGLNREIYPDIPNQNYTKITDGYISSGISIKHGNIVFYKENGEEISKEDVEDSFYTSAVNRVKKDIRLKNEEDETILIEKQSEDKKYLILETKTMNYNDIKTKKLIHNRSNQQK